MWRFTPFLMWHADDGDFLYCWVAQEATFHLDRRDVLAAADNDILKTVADFNKTVRVNDCSVTRVEPSVSDRRVRRHRIILIALHDDVVSHSDFAKGLSVVWHLVSIFVRNPELSGTHELDALA